MNVIKLAQLARDAELNEYHLRTLKYLARPWNVQRPYDPIKYGDTALPMWEIQLLGAVGRACHAANEFIDRLEAILN